MKYIDFTMAHDGFAGHLAEPDGGSDCAVIVIMGGERSLLPGLKIAQRFADFGFIGLAVSLFGAENMPDRIDRIPLEMFAPAVNYLREQKKVSNLSIYGMSMGSVFACLAAQYLGNIDNLVLCSPAHVPFEGTMQDRKHMTGHSIAVCGGKEIPYVSPDFLSGNLQRYVYDAASGRTVTKMWTAFRDAYRDKKAESKAALRLEKTGARILLIAGTGDEEWPSDYSVKYMKRRLDQCGYDKEYQCLVYKNASHLIGVMPNQERSPWLYRAIPIIGLMYRSFRTNREQCMNALYHSEQEIINWLQN